MVRDDIALKSVKYDHEPRSLRMAAMGMRALGSGQAPLHRFRLGLDFAISGHREVDGMIAHHAAIARAIGEQLVTTDRCLDAIGASYERWDGRGWPGDLGGDDIPLASRIAHVAEFIEVANRLGGFPAVRRLAQERSGGDFDPVLASLVDAEADVILSGLDTVGAWSAVIDAEPALAIVLTDDSLDAALLAIGNFVDLKSPYFLGHSRAVAELSAEAGAPFGLAETDVQVVRRAGLVHGLGRLGISNAILDKRGPIGAGEWERVPHAAVSDRPHVAPVGGARANRPDRGAARERLDSSGYPRGLSGSAISREARILAVADSYQAMREPRPHRASRTAEEAAAELLAEVKAGRYDADAVAAVLGAAATAWHGDGKARGVDTTRGRSAQTARARAVEQGNRRPTGDIPEDCQQSRGAHLREDQRSNPHRRQPFRHATRPPARGGVPLRHPRLSRQPTCIACMFFIITASVLRSSAAGLNNTSSVPGSCLTGM